MGEIKDVTEATPTSEKTKAYIVMRSYDFPDDRDAIVCGVSLSYNTAREIYFGVIGKIVNDWDDIENNTNYSIYRNKDYFSIENVNEGYCDSVRIMTMELK